MILRFKSKNGITTKKKLSFNSNNFYMYKVLVFLKKSNEETVIDHFRKFFAACFSNLIGKEIDFGTVESNPLLEIKYSLFFEIDFESKEKWERLLGSEAGKELEKDLIEFHKYITIIFVDYEHLSN